jgi:hypothetical protein
MDSTYMYVLASMCDATLSFPRRTPQARHGLGLVKALRLGLGTKSKPVMTVMTSQ